MRSSARPTRSRPRTTWPPHWSAHHGIPTFAIKGEDRDSYYGHIGAALDHRPEVTMDDGADLVNELHTRRTELLDGVVGGTEETTTGVIRLRAMAKAGKLAYPVVAVNEALTKHLFDNRYGTGQSAIDGILRATNILFAGKTVVIGGYGWVGRGIASRAHGMGSNVVVVEVDPVRALEAAMDGFRVMSAADAARAGRRLHQRHRQPECLGPRPLPGDARRGRPGQCRALQRRVRARRARGAGILVARGRPFTREYVMADGRRLYVLADGRLVNLGRPRAIRPWSWT